MIAPASRIDPADHASIDVSKQPASTPHGILPIDKPVGITSHDVVDIIRGSYRTRRVGHTGTLDPRASGLLLIVLGNATKIATYLSGMDKTYLATIHFGATSATGDAEGPLTPTGNVNLPQRRDLETIIPRFIGEVELDVPAHAAVRSGGQRRYDLARRGEPVPPARRRTFIQDIELISCNPPEAEIRVRCATGTYIRALAEAMGQAVGCGAYLGALRRERVGPHSVENAHDLDDLQSVCRANGTLPEPRPIEEFLTLPQIVIADDCVVRVRHGQRICRNHIVTATETLSAGDAVALRAENGSIVAVGTALTDGPELLNRPRENREPVFQYARVLV